MGLEDESSSIKHNWTAEFIRFLKVNNETADFSFILLTIGAGGSGKTAVAFMISHVLLEADPKRHVLLYQVPEGLIPAIHESLKANGLESWCSRFKRIEHLREVDVNAILIFDEGVLQANAKEALMKEMVDFEQDLSFSRHKRTIVLMNSVDDGILLAYRKKAHITIYKQLNKGFVDNVRNDKFVKQYRTELTKLDVREAIVYSTYKYFNNKIGKLKMDLKLYCPWYNDKISRNMEGSTFSAQFSRYEGNAKLVEEYAKKAVDAFGKDLIKKARMKSILLGWMEETFPDKYFDLKRYIDSIYNRAVYKEYMSQKGAAEDDETGSMMEPELESSETMQDENDPDQEAMIETEKASDQDVKVPEPKPESLVVLEPKPQDPNDPFLHCYDAINTFSYNKADILADYGRDRDIDTSSRELNVAVYNRYNETGKLDVVSKEFNSPVDPSKKMSVNGVRLMVRRVSGFLANKVGLLFEPVIERELKKAFPLARIYHGKEKKPDFIVFQPGVEPTGTETDPPLAASGTIFVYSVKCYDSLRSKTSLPVSEHDPEIKYCQRVQAIAAGKGKKIDIRLTSLYFNIANRNWTQHAIDFLFPKDIEIDETRDVA